MTMDTTAYPDPARGEGNLETGQYFAESGYGGPRDIALELNRQASQENCDGDPYDAMVFAASYITHLRSLLPAGTATSCGHAIEKAWPAVPHGTTVRSFDDAGFEAGVRAAANLFAMEAPASEPEDGAPEVQRRMAEANRQKILRLLQDRSPHLDLTAPRAPERRGLYMASKAVAHGPRWQGLRANGLPIISTWIDECDPGATLDWPDLWLRCLSEVVSAEAVIVYMEPGEVLKGAWVEVGAALAMGVPVIGVGIEEFSIAKSGMILTCDTIEDAIETFHGIRAGSAMIEANAACGFRDRWVRIFCDYMAEGVWQSDGSRGDLADLPVSDGLKARLLAWQEVFEDWPHDRRLMEHPDYEAYCEEGFRIDRDMKTEMPEWTVIYLDEARCAQHEFGQPRGNFEYEITARRAREGEKPPVAGLEGDHA